ncbi:hypothetical protein LTR04_000863 [Oleoguttula sp. CCFEE 6159]|nr:hypothetical protein LTR04_000863 [Oleoguttula sp. CCFEE 6159]
MFVLLDAILRGNSEDKTPQSYTGAGAGCAQAKKPATGTLTVAELQLPFVAQPPAVRIFNNQRNATPVAMADRAPPTVFPDTRVSLPAHAITSLPQLAGRKRRHGRPPAEEPKRQRARLAGRPTRLRKGTRVKVEIPMDIWREVFAVSHPKELFQARMLNRKFHEEFSYSNTWKRSRLNFYGTEMPPPPEGLKEWQYLDLVTGRGCMSAGCRKETRNPYWAFLRRWCEECFLEKIIKADAAKASMLQYPDLLDCIPSALVDSWYNYQCVNYDCDTLRHLNYGPKNIIYLKSDVIRIKNEYEEFRSRQCHNSGARFSDKSEEQLHWVEQRTMKTSSRLQEIRAVEKWDNNRSREKVEANKDIKQRRRNFYISKAKELVPPLEEAALRLIPAFFRFCNVPNEPTLRSWNNLLKKLEPQRAKAEAMVRAERLARAGLQLSPYVQYTKIRQLSNTIPEVELVLSLADESMKELDVHAEHGDLADFVICALRAVWCKYQDVSDDAKPTSPFDHNRKYSLSLLDVNTVMDEKILPALDLDKRKKGSGRFLLCPGCKRNDINRRFTVEELFEHIYEKHATAVGDFDIFRQGNSRGALEETLLYCAIPWSRNLPMLASHHKATGRWDPDDSSPYQHAPRASDLDDVNISLLAGRSVSRDPIVGSDRFVDDVLHAASLLRDTTLKSQHRSQLALWYARDRYKLRLDGKQRLEESIRARRIGDGEPSFSACEDLVRELARVGDFDLFSGFHCKACEFSISSRNIKWYGRKGVSFGELSRHYKEFGSRLDDTHELREWSTRMISLPTEQELCLALSEPGMETAMQTFDLLFPADSVEEGGDDSVGIDVRLAVPMVDFVVPGTDSAEAYETLEGLDDIDLLSAFDLMSSETFGNTYSFLFGPTGI